MALRNRAFVFVFLTVLVFVTYRNGLVAVPSADQLQLIQERTFVNSDAEYFLKSLSYDRTRQLNPGNTYLFRPVATSILTLEEIFFHDHWKVIGALSIFAHVLVCFALYLIFEQSIPPLWCLAFVSLFAVQYAGGEAILWRHISPYMISILFFLVGARLFVRDSKKNQILAAICFFISMLAHETLALALPMFGVLVYALKKQNRWTPLCFLTPAVYWVMNGVDYFVRNPANIAGSAKVSAGVGNAVSNLFYVSGVFLQAFLFPFLVKLVPSTTEDPRWQWAFYDEPSVVFILLGLVCFALLGVVAWKEIKRAKTLDEKSATLFLLLSYFAVLIVGVGWGRVTRWGYEYFSHSTYYFYFSNLALLAIAVVFFSRVRFQAIVGVVLAAYVGLNFVKIQERTHATETRDEVMANVVHWVTQRVQSSPGLCFAGSLTNALSEKVPSRLFYRDSCTIRQVRPVFMVPATSNRLALIEGNPLEWKSVLNDLDLATLSSGNFFFDDGKQFLFNFEKDPSADPSVVLSKTALDVRAIRFIVDKPWDIGFIVGYRGQENYILYVIIHGIIDGVYQMKEGSLYKLLPPRIDGSPERVELSMRKIKGPYFAFKEGVVASKLESITDKDLEGRIGILVGQDPRNAQKILDLAVSPSYADDSIKVESMLPYDVSPLL